MMLLFIPTLVSSECYGFGDCIDSKLNDLEFGVNRIYWTTWTNRGFMARAIAKIEKNLNITAAHPPPPVKPPKPITCSNEIMDYGFIRKLDKVKHLELGAIESNNFMVNTRRRLVARLKAIIAATTKP